MRKSPNNRWGQPGGACGGVTAIEVTMTTPGALDVVRQATCIRKEVLFGGSCWMLAAGGHLTGSVRVFQR
jgi:hypothetical protein